MIYLILDAYIAATKTKMKYFMPLILALILLALMGASLILACMFTPLWLIGFIVFIVMFFWFLWSQNNKLMNNAKTRFEHYNIKLDKLKEILQSFSFSDSLANSDSLAKKEKKNSWYSAERIKYLAKMCDNLNHNNSMVSDKSIVFLKTYGFAVLGFAAGVIAEKASLEISLTLAIWVFLIIACCFALVKLNDLINFLLFKNNSREKIMELKSDLMDLLLRDFPENAELELKEMIKVE